MTDSFKKAGYDMFYLCRCVLLGGKAKPSKIETFDLDAIYEMCQHNSLTAMVCEALQQSGIEVDQKWKDAYAKSLRKNMLLDAERSKIFDMLDKNKIWHIALKGVHMKNFYPSMGMRQMADNDILYDSSRQNDVTSIFTELGYNADSIGKSHHDVYFKEPIYNFEMHTSLMGKYSEMYDYYKNIKDKLLPVDGKTYEYRFKDEDFYIYMTAHAFKHYSGGGTGLRTLIDYYVYLNKKERDLDWVYVHKECEKLKISDFEKDMRTLSAHAFKRDLCLTDNEWDLLRYLLFSGTYGTLENSIKHKAETIGADSKLKYMLVRIFPNKAWLEKYEPIVAEYPVLYPFYLIRRVYRLIFVTRKARLKEFRAWKEMNNKSFNN